MAGTRKTLDREALLRPLNAALASDADGTVGRRTVALVAEAALLDSNSYRGFRYLPSELDAKGSCCQGTTTRVGSISEREVAHLCRT